MKDEDHRGRWRSEHAGLAPPEQEMWLLGQRQALESAVNDAPPEVSLGVLVSTAVAAFGDGTRAAFYVANDEGTSLRHLVGMPDAYAQAVASSPLGPESLAWGLATRDGEAVITADVTQDGRWKPWRWLAERFEYRSCWSFPMRTAAGKLVGTFAIYLRRPREPTDRERMLASLLTHTASIILSRDKEREARRAAEAARQQAEGALRDSEERIQAILRQAPLGIGVVDQRGQILTCNERWRRMAPETLPSRDAPQGWRWQALVEGGRALQADEHPGSRALRGETVSPGVDFRHLRPDGGEVWTRVSASPMQNGQGEVVGAIVVMEDVTQQKQAEAALGASEARYRTLFEAIDEGYCVLRLLRDATGRIADLTIVDANPAFARHVGLSDVIGRSVFELIPNLEQHWIDGYARVADTGRAERREGHVGGVDRWYRVHQFRIGDAGDDLVGVAFEDVSERRRREIALRESEEKYRTLFETMDEGFCIVEKLAGAALDFRFIEVNPAFERQSGLAGVVGRTVREVVPAMEASVLAAVDHVATTGRAARFEAHVAALDLWVDVYAARIGVGDRQRLVGVLFNNINERKRAEAALRAKQERQAFLLRLSDALRALSDPLEVQREACRVLGEHLGVERTQYGEVDLRRRVITITRDHCSTARHAGALPSLVGEYGLDACPAHARSWLAQRPLVVGDVAREPTLSESERLALLSRSIRATLSAPLVKDGVPVVVMTAVSSVPRQWTPEEVDLLQETADRAWSAVERARAEAALRQSEEGQRIATEAARLGVFEWYLGDDRPIWNNDRVYEIFGLSRAELPISKQELEAAYLHPDDRGAFDRALQQAICTGGDFQASVRVRRRSDGQWRWIEHYGAFVLDEAKQPVKLNGVLRDVTERKQAEQALRQSEERFRRFGEASSDVLWIRSAATLDWEYLSPAFERVYGRERGSVMSAGDLRHWAELIVPQDRAAALASIERVRSGERVSFEYRIRRPDGQVRWVRDTEFPISDGDGRIVRIGGIGRDVTEQKQNEQELKELNQRLEDRVEIRTRQVRELSRRLTVAEQEERRRIAHILHEDLQQILYGLNLKMGLFRKALVESDRPELAQSVDDTSAWVEQAIRTARRLTVDLSPPVLQKEELATMLTWLHRQMRELHGLEVTLEAESVVPLEDEGLRLLLFQIVRELLFNVKKHAGTNRATVRLKQERDQVVIIVADQGRGFDTGDLVADEAVAGGFGLFSVRERLGLLGGRMLVRSEPRGGTRIDIYAPLH